MEEKKIYIFDTTLRDGEQVPGMPVEHDRKGGAGKNRWNS